MAAYASLLSLGQILHQLLEYPPRQMAVLDKNQIDSLRENIIFLQEFLEDFSMTRGDDIEALEEKIARSAYAAENIIENHVVDQILGNAKARSENITLFRQDLQILRNSKTESRRRGIFSHFKLLLKKRTALPNVSRSSTLFSRNIIESRDVDQILDDSEVGSERSSSTLFCPDLQKIIEDFGSLKKDVMRIKETEGIKIVQQPKKDVTVGSSIRGASNNKNTMVGFDDDLIQIMDKLTGHQSNLRIVSIVGMGGIGKTTLARNVYHHPCIVQHFHVHAWVTISQQYILREIILALLKDVRKEEELEKIKQLTNEELGEQLYKSLSGRKYLIVMDDVWSTECWDDIKRFLPDNGKGSRVMVTTRLSNVADHFRPCTTHQLHFLDEDQSWALFCDKVFGKESCPPELEEVGKTIVRNCGALPLAIVVIGGLLAKSRRTIKYWEHVANDTYAALNMGGDGLCLKILSLSYKHLPVHLKSCFLYMAIFPEDHKIKISRLVKLWVAEGMLKPMDSKSLEEVAMDNLKDLLDRNLIMTHGYGSRNQIKTCTIHDLLRDLCLREAQREKFLCVTTIHSLNSHPRSINSMRLIIQHSSGEEECQQQAFDAMNPASCTRSLVCRKLNSTSMELPVSFRRLRVLWMDEIDLCKKILQLVNLKFIEFQAPSNTNLSNHLESLSVLWNLQSITISGTWPMAMKRANLPAEIWEMPQLRHLKMVGIYKLPDPPSTKSKNGIQDFLVLKNLQTLYKIRNFRCLDEVIHRIPNLKKLGVTYNKFHRDYGRDYYEVKNLVHLCNLESLLLDCGNDVLQNICFPHSLKKLTLSYCVGVCWEDLTVVGLLPNLEVLKLMSCPIIGGEWNPVEGEFLKLKFLQIRSIDLEEWRTSRCHFSRLENLTFEFVEHLKEIPYGIGEIPTLRLISLTYCSESVESSAKKIQEEQQNLGNHDLQVHITSYGPEQLAYKVGFGIEVDGAP